MKDKHDVFDTKLAVITDGMKNDMKEIEYLINNQDKINEKKRIIKNLKISKNIFKVSLPFILLPLITNQVFKTRKCSPFILEDVIEKQKIVREIGSFDNTNTISDDEIITLIKSDDYKANNSDINKIVSELSNTEIMKSPYSKIFIYNEQNELVIIKKQSFRENCVDIAAFVIINCLLEIILLKIMKHQIKKVKEKNDLVRKEYCPLDTELLKQKLKIKQDSYHRLMG